MAKISFTTKGFKEFEKAIRRNPTVVLARGRVFLNRSLMAYRRVIEGTPWRIGQSGGGAPRSTGDLSKSHKYQVDGLKGIVSFDENPNPSRSNAPYGVFVHQGTRKMEKRPWLDYAVTNADNQVESYYKDFLDKVVKELAS
jgi:HK97 gp10 family phage protein